MKLLSIVVDELPERCGECPFRNDLWCPAKGLSIESGQQWIGRPEGRHENCPLELPKMPF